MGGIIKNIQISGYDSAISYDKYDVVSAQTGFYPIYFVSAQSGNSGQFDGSTYASNAFWKRFDDPDFNFSTVWNPSYQTALTVDLKPKLSPFGDGYAQKVDTSIFFNRLSYEVSFDMLRNRELKSLLSFFEYKGGTDFVKMDIPPFITGRKFLGKSWKHAYQADDVNSFSVSMFEFISDKNV